MKASTSICYCNVGYGRSALISRCLCHAPVALSLLSPVTLPAPAGRPDGCPCKPRQRHGTVSAAVCPRSAMRMRLMTYRAQCTSGHLAFVLIPSIPREASSAASHPARQSQSEDSSGALISRETVQKLEVPPSATRMCRDVIQQPSGIASCMHMKHAHVHHARRLSSTMGSPSRRSAASTQLLSELPADGWGARLPFTLYPATSTLRRACRRTLTTPVPCPFCTCVKAITRPLGSPLVQPVHLSDSQWTARCGAQCTHLLAPQSRGRVCLVLRLACAAHRMAGTRQLRPC